MPIQDDQFQQVPRSIRTEHQIPNRILGHLLDHDRVLHTMLDLLVVDAVPAARRKDLHMRIVLRNQATLKDRGHGGSVSRTKGYGAQSSTS